MVQAAKVQAERDKQFAENQNKILTILMDLQSTMLRVTSKLDMERKLHIDQFFPVKVDADMREFLNKDDGQFKVKREEFENWLYCTVTTTLKLKRPFESSLLAALFSREYIRSHKWPGPR